MDKSKLTFWQTCRLFFSFKYFWPVFLFWILTSIYARINAQTFEPALYIPPIFPPYIFGMITFYSLIPFFAFSLMSYFFTRQSDVVKKI